MYGWGDTSCGELGLGDSESDSSVPEPTVSSWNHASDVVLIATGEFHTLFLTDDGHLYSSGKNEEGQLGREEESSTQPELVETFTGIQVVAAACGAQHCLALNEWGQTYSWGYNIMGQLGCSLELFVQKKPKVVKGLATFSVVQIACGSYHSVALTNSGDLYSWGSNSYGQLGLGTTTPKEDTPQLIGTLAGIPIALIACGANHTIVVSKSGAIFSWGKNTHGQLGLQDTENKCYPTQIKTLRSIRVCYAVAGDDFSAFLTLEGGVFTCGAGEDGQTGHGTKKDEYVPRKVMELMGAEVSQIACGRRHLLCVMSESGSVRACGSNQNGQLGMGSALTDSSWPETVRIGGKENGPWKKAQRIKDSGEVGNRSCTLSAQDLSNSEQVTQAVSQSRTRTVDKSMQDLAAKSSSATTRKKMSNTRVARIFAGYNRSFALEESQKRVPGDLRLRDPSTQILSLTHAKLESCLAFKENDPVNQDLLMYMETVFGSLACINSSFLTSGISHYNCNSKSPGVDLAQAKEAFSIIGRIESQSLKELMVFQTRQLLSTVRASPPDAEALRMFLLLPFYHEMLNPRHQDYLQGELARAFVYLTSAPGRIVRSWWELQSRDYFEGLVGMFRNVVVYQVTMNKPFRTDTPVMQNILLTLSMLNKMNFSNPKLPKVPPETFHIPDLCEHVDIRNDYLNWLTDVENVRSHICNYPFLFDVQCKTMLLLTDQQLQMQTAVNRAATAMLTSLLFNPTAAPSNIQFLYLHVSRENIVQDTVRQISELDSSSLKKPLKVKFHGEEAEDGGGVRKEFFMLLVKEMFDPKYGMFKSSEETNAIWFSQQSFEEAENYFLVGVIYGLAIYNFTLIYVPFPLALYRKLLGASVGLDDLADLQPGLAGSLRHLLDYEGDDVEEVFCLCFAVSSESFGVVRSVPLKEGGEEISVTKENRQEYVDLYVDYWLNKSVERQFKEFNDGFQKVCGGRILKLFEAHELMAVVVGNEEYDWEVFENNAQYKEGYSAADQTIKWFWEVFHEMTLTDKKKFLLYLTGSDRIPLQGMKAIQITIQPMSDDRYFPVAHTCVNLLDLPRYKTKERLKYHMLTAIQQNQGFSLV